MPAIVQKKIETGVATWKDVKHGEYFVWGMELYLETPWGPIRCRDGVSDARNEIEDDSSVEIVIPKITY